MLQIAMLVMGIVVMFTGKMTISKSSVVLGWRARLVGLVLASGFPIAFIIGLSAGIYAGANGIPVESLDWLMFVDIGAVLFCAVAGALLCLLFKQPVQQPGGPMYAPGMPPPPGSPPIGMPSNYIPPPPPPPSDPNNPYQSPWSK